MNPKSEFQRLAVQFDSVIQSRLATSEPFAQQHLTNLGAVIKFYAATYEVAHDDPKQIEQSVTSLQYLLDWLTKTPDSGMKEWHVIAFISDWDQTLQFALLRLPPTYERKTKLPLVVNLPGADSPNPIEFLAEITKKGDEPVLDGQSYLSLIPWRRGNVAYTSGASETILQSIDKTAASYPVDMSRVGLIGHSMGGGGGVWRLALRYPDRWNAVCAEAPASELVPKIGDEDILSNGVNFPWRFWIGEKEWPLLKMKSEAMRLALDKVGAKTVAVETPGAGHSPPSEAHRENLLWLLRQAPRVRPNNFKFACQGMDASYYGYKPLSMWGVWMHPEFQEQFVQNFEVSVTETQITLTTRNARKVTIDPQRLGVIGKKLSVVWNGDIVFQGEIGQQPLIFGKDDDPLKPVAPTIKKTQG